MFADLEQKLAYTFTNNTLITIAFCHSSTNNKINYERLEFLGDRVLGLVIANWLYKNYTDEDEGDLAKRFSNLVNEKSLLKIAQELEIFPLLQVNNPNIVINKSIIADALEAIIAVIYLESNLTTAEKVILRIWQVLLNNMSAKPPIDYKSALQEWSQKYFNCLPEYIILEKQGEDHSPIFVVKAKLPNDMEMQAQGISIREAEKEAARLLLEIIA